LSKTEVHENPLVPDKKLRQIYVSMVEARSLDDYINRLQGSVKRRRKLDSTRGQEACRISTAIDLAPGDLVSDSQMGVVMERLAGETMSFLLQRADALCSLKKVKESKTAGVARRFLPWIEYPVERLRLVLGAALSFKVSGRPNVVVAYVSRGSVSKGDWRRLLSLAAKLELPVIFVVLPSIRTEKTAKNISLSDRARRWGVPGVPVDAGDAMALYRVAQESLGRIRSGDGPVLIECLEFRSQNQGANDPLTQLRDSLIHRKVCAKSWLNGVDRDIRRRIEAAKR
jgi:TPP-dependent pyruvate/acetoin dehydrogenase alpha subunit